MRVTARLYAMAIVLTAGAWAQAGVVALGAGNATAKSDTVTWISSAKPRGGSLRIARTTSDGKDSEIAYLTDSPYNDYKPVISPDGSKIAFFRAYREDPQFLPVQDRHLRYERRWQRPQNAAPL